MGVVSIIKFINFLTKFKGVAYYFGVAFIYKPAYFIARLFFYKVIVKGYALYLSLLKKMGWTGLRKDFFYFIFNQKLAHVLVIIVTVFLIFINIASKAQSYSLTEQAQNTMLAKLITSEFGDIQEDQDVIVESFEEGAPLAPDQQSYIDGGYNLKPQPLPGEEDLDDEGLATINDGSAIVKPDLASTKITEKVRTETIEYTVKPGDSISTIADEFGISVNTILWENSLTAYSVIRPGDKLLILPLSGITHTVKRGDTMSSISSKYNIDADKILEANKLASAEGLRVGEKLLIPGGSKIYAPVVSKTYTGFTAIKDIVSSGGTKPVAGNKMNWPTVGKRITQYFSWRHKGLDIANKVGTPLYAADAGVVEQAQWGNGYGYFVLIDHGGGKKTRYAHCSKFYVTKGERVAKGQNIAAMGSTGWSTGPHIHFEVIINGTLYNPLNYIK